MKVLSATQTAHALPWRALIDCLDKAFQKGCNAPIRHHHNVSIPNEKAATLLIMPAWQEGEFLGIKHVFVVPENHRRARPSVAASYHLYSAISGEQLAIIDGGELTNRRTAAASALASSYLSRSDSSHLLMVGAGVLAPYLIAAHCQVRPIKKISVWARDTLKAQAMIDDLGITEIPVKAVDNLSKTTLQADIVSCATLSSSPLVLGQHIKSGTHVDLVGAFTPDMRESDDNLITNANLFVDTKEGVLSEGGDVLQVLNKDLISEQDIKAELFDLTTKKHFGRESNGEITVFKSVGTALEDLAAGVLAYKNHNM